MSKDIKLVHSWWSNPMFVKNIGIHPLQKIVVNFYNNALSLWYAKNRLGNNVKFKCYTDALGYEVLKALPYDEFKFLSIPQDNPISMWAQSKMYALTDMELGEIHIDGDVFLKKNEIIPFLDFENYDLIVQSIEEDKDTLNRYYLPAINILSKYNKELGIDISYKPAYNCGVVGFNNNELKQKYINFYFNALNLLKENPNISTELLNSNAVPDLVLEQQAIHTISDGYKIKNMLGEGDSVNENAIKYGFQHLLGTFKYDDFYIVKTVISRLDSEYFNFLFEIEKDIIKNIGPNIIKL